MEILGQRVLLREIKKEEKTAAGIILQNQVPTGISKGEVEAKGQVKDPKEGDEVLYKTNKALTISLKGIEYKLLELEDILIIL